VQRAAQVQWHRLTSSRKWKPKGWRLVSLHCYFGPKSTYLGFESSRACNDRKLPSLCTGCHCCSLLCNSRNNTLQRHCVADSILRARLLCISAEDSGLLSSAPQGSAGAWSLRKKVVAGLVSVALLAGVAAYVRPGSSIAGAPSAFDSSSGDAEDSEPGSFDELGRFVLRDYDTAKPWASFLPGLGGKFGVPMWVSASTARNMLHGVSLQPC
jgi:hypothetical protein